jgi:hypothetical protein
VFICFHLHKFMKGIGYGLLFFNQCFILTKILLNCGLGWPIVAIAQVGLMKKVNFRA